MLEWDVELIEGLFYDRDVEEILKLPIGVGGVEDKLIWNFEKTRMYSVRSTYGVYLDHVNHQPELSVQGPWLNVWSLNVPPKVKHMVWRLGREVVPRRVVYAIDCWRSAGVYMMVRELVSLHDTFAGWLEGMLSSPHDQFKETCSTVLWGMWRERNRRVWSRESLAADMAVKLAVEDLKAWQLARKAPVSLDGGQRLTACGKWHAPPAGLLKCNSDASFFDDDRLMGAGMILRDDHGQARGYRMWHGSGCWSPREGEAAALASAMAWVSTGGHTKVIFEIDTEEVARAISSTEPDESEFGCLITTCLGPTTVIP
ncbi:hypothetical protein LINPERHAP2_LOCUS25969 [Linum perenne]